MTGATCRTCGCTDGNCAQCIERLGSPCWWVEADLCSVCAGIGVSLAQYVARDVCLRYGAPGSLVILHDRRGGLQLGSAAESDAAARPLLTITEIIDTALVSLVGGTPRPAPQPRPADRAACIHCLQDVCDAGDVAAIREHSMTCAKSPVVQELQRLQFAADANLAAWREAHKQVDELAALRFHAVTTREAAAIRWLVAVAQSAGDGEHDDAIASLLDKAQYAGEASHV